MRLGESVVEITHQLVTGGSFRRAAWLARIALATGTDLPPAAGLGDIGGHRSSKRAACDLERSAR
jgi:hypothetical protein